MPFLLKSNILQNEKFKYQYSVLNLPSHNAYFLVAFDQYQCNNYVVLLKQIDKECRKAASARPLLHDFGKTTKIM